MKSTSLQKDIYEEHLVKIRKERSDEVVVSSLKTIFRSMNKRIFRILDIGCGGGQLLDLFAKMHRFKVYGLDISQKAIEKAKERGYKAFLCNVEKEKLPFDNKSIDIAIMVDLLEHISDPDRVLKEVRRVLNTEGKLIICAPNVSHPFSWFMQIFLDLPPMWSARYKSIHVKDYTLRMLRLVLQLNGFRIERIKGTYLFPFNNNIGRFIANLFPRLSERLILTCEKGVIPDFELDGVYFNIKELLRIGEKL